MTQEVGLNCVLIDFHIFKESDSLNYPNRHKQKYLLKNNQHRDFYVKNLFAQGSKNHDLNFKKRFLGYNSIIKGTNSSTLTLTISPIVATPSQINSSLGSL